MPAPEAHDIRLFLPASDFELSQAFYAALGWQVRLVDRRLALIELAGHRHYLQDYYVREWAENCVMHISVNDAAAWHEHVRNALARRDFAGARVRPPVEEPYGALVTYAWDPSGVLLHFAEWRNRPPTS